MWDAHSQVSNTSIEGSMGRHSESVEQENPSKTKQPVPILKHKTDSRPGFEKKVSVQNYPLESGGTSNFNNSSGAPSSSVATPSLDHVVNHKAFPS